MDDSNNKFPDDKRLHLVIFSADGEESLKKHKGPHYVCLDKFNAYAEEIWKDGREIHVVSVLEESLAALSTTGVRMYFYCYITERNEA